MKDVRLRQRDRIPVYDEGEEITLFNHATVRQDHHVRLSTVDTTTIRLMGGHTNREPEAITPWLAKRLSDEFGVNVSSYKIIDPNDAIIL